MTQRLLLVARRSSIEPLGIHYLSGLAHSLGWDVRVFLTDDNADELFREVGSWKPDFAGFQVWTGYHLAAFEMCDRVRAMGVPVIIGGPHATYFAADCARHADHVVVGDGFRMLSEILDGHRSAGEHFDPVQMAGGFPLPHRAPLYDAYPEYAKSPIKSIFASSGCPFKCTYCYAPVRNKMYGRFELNVQTIDDIIADARAIQERWPVKMIYFQDDIFGLRIDWLEEFSRRWRTEIGVPWHCQIRLELTRKGAGDKRLDLFAEGGCSGITLAIESGNQFLRDHVLFRPMPEELIIEGCRKVETAVIEIGRHVEEHGVKCVVVDYAGRLSARGKDRYEQMTNVSLALSACAQRHQIIMLVLCQLNRAIESRNTFTPSMSDLKETGQFEQDADVVLFPVWPWIVACVMLAAAAVRFIMWMTTSPPAPPA